MLIAEDSPLSVCPDTSDARWGNLMDEAYAVFDTLSMEGDYEVPTNLAPQKPATSEPAPVLLKVPHVGTDSETTTPAPAPKRTRVDARGVESQPHTWSAREYTATPAIEPPASTSATTNLRFDPGSSVSAEAPPQKGATQAVHPDAYAETLLQLDAMVAPYARWIALAAVIAAIGLTLVLLRDQASAPLNDSPGDTINQAQSVSEDLGVFADLGPLDPIKPSFTPPTTPATAMIIEAPAGPASTPTVAETTTAAGPVSAPSLAARPSRVPAVQLTGEVGPVGVGQSPNAPAIATRPQPDGYPRTAGYPSTDGSTRR